MPNRCLLLLCGVFLSVLVYAQEDTTQKSPFIDGKYLISVREKAAKLEAQLDSKSQKVLSAFLRKEEKMRRKLARKDSTAASRIFSGTADAYSQVKSKLQSPGELSGYIPSIDTLATSLKFLEQNPQWLKGIAGDASKLPAAIQNVNELKSKFRGAEDVQQFLKERRQYLKDQLANLGFAKELKSLSKEAYYYQAQVNEYKQVLKDHKKAEKKAMELLSKTQLFKDFMRKNSQLASLFRLPTTDPNDPNMAASLAGLQTRTQVNGLVQQQISAGGPNAQAQFNQNMQQAQAQMNQLKQKLQQLGGGGENLDMPRGFKPNSQRTKTFLQRIEYGTTIQSQKANGFWPVTSDIALTAGYKLNDNSIIGIGAGYKMGWGRSISRVKITHEGMSLRSFIDVGLKRSFWITGGYEMNYREGFDRIAQLKDRSGWQESGLIGISKVVDMRSKLLKKTKVQLLWDFLSCKQLPKPAPIQFRIGYTF
ncbi:MAG: hypothetical protein ABW007_10160 [Chitinophagaceae bacterium]